MRSPIVFRNPKTLSQETAGSWGHSHQLNNAKLVVGLRDWLAHSGLGLTLQI